MKKRNKIWGLLLLSGMLLTGCLDEKGSDILENNSNVSENSGDVNSNDSNNGDENNENNEENSGDVNEGNENNQGEENQGNENQGEENNQGNEGNENQGNQGENQDNEGNEGNENQGNEANENQGNEGNEGNENQDIPAKSDWDEDEKAIFDEIFYGLDVPYQYFENEEPLEYYEDYATAMKYVEEIEPESLLAYYELFDDTWDDLCQLDSYYFNFEKTIETEEGKRIVCIEFYAADDYGDVDTSGYGALYFLVYEPYDYEWPGYVFDYLCEDFEITATVPAFDADYYYVFDTYYDFGFLGLYCYTDSLTAEADYLKILLEAGYVFYETDEYGDDWYMDPNGALEINFGYDSIYGDLDIYVQVVYHEQELDLEGDSLDREAFGIADITDTAYALRYASGESGATYEGNMSAGTGIQLRSKNNSSGIISRTSGGVLVAVGVVWNEQTPSDKELLIYASNEPFEIADMYNSKSDKCVCVGSLTNDGSGDAFYFEEEYTYIGLRSQSGAIYLDEIIICWDNGEEEPEDDDEEVAIPVGDDVIGVR